MTVYFSWLFISCKCGQNLLSLKVTFQCPQTTRTAPYLLFTTHFFLLSYLSILFNLQVLFPEGSRWRANPNFPVFPSVLVFLDLSLPLTTTFHDSMLSGSISPWLYCPSLYLFFFPYAFKADLQYLFLVYIYFLCILSGSVTDLLEQLQL